MRSIQLLYEWRTYPLRADTSHTAVSANLTIADKRQLGFVNAAASQRMYANLPSGNRLVSHANPPHQSAAYLLTKSVGLSSIRCLPAVPGRRIRSGYNLA